MEKYKKLVKIGHGTFGVVWKALNTENDKLVAIKRLRARCYYSAEESMINLTEVESLIKMKNHPNIVKLEEVFKHTNYLFLVFECMQGSLYDRMVSRMTPFSEAEIRDLCFQIFQGLAYMHQNGYFHRDLKPMNLLVHNDIIKIGDLGSARETDGGYPYTDSVTTPFYRAPEMFLHSGFYNSAIDIWAMGAIMAELFTFQPLFEGHSEAHVMHNICSVLGTPTESTWREGLDLARNINYQFPECSGKQFSALLPSASPDAVNLIAALLSWDPRMRPTAIEALQHPFFNSCYHLPASLRHEPPIVTAALVTAPILFEMVKHRELLKWPRTRKDLPRLLPAHLYESEIEKVEDSREDSIRLLPEHP